MHDRHNIIGPSNIPTDFTRAEKIIDELKNKVDMVNNPPHYTKHPSGIECIDVIEEMPFNIGAAVKYLWRVDLKDNPVENLEKAKWYIEREIKRRLKEHDKQNQY